MIVCDEVSDKNSYAKIWKNLGNIYVVLNMKKNWVGKVDRALEVLTSGFIEKNFAIS